jgi:hypothetical protein
VLTQLQLEGPELEPLLVRVRSELGSSARIVQAEKVRSGGVAGFFARERYELTVEVDDEQPRTAAPAVLRAPVGVAPPVTAPAAPHAPFAAAPAPAATAPAAATASGAPAAAAAPAAATAPAAAQDGAPAPVVPSFAAVTGLGGPADRPTDAFSPIAGLSTGEPRGPHDAVAAALAGPVQNRTADRAPAPEPFSAHPAFPALAEHVPTAAPAAATASAAPAPRSLLELADQVSDEEQAAVVSTESPSFASLLTSLGSSLGSEPAVPATAVEPPAAPSAGATTAPAPAAAPADVAVRISSDVAVPAAARTTVEGSTAADTTGVELARLGLPPHLRPQASGEQLHTALRAALTRLPTAPPATNRAGGVLAVVGPLTLALRVAREIAEELGLPVTTSVAVATSGDSTPQVPARQVLHAPDEAADRRATWRRRGNLTVVAVEAPLTSTGAADARDFLAALAPSATWGVVEATRKAQDIGAWTRALGGVHALALTDVEETADPAAVLELGIPVSRLGGRAATPRAWATLLTGRLAA